MSRIAMDNVKTNKIKIMTFLELAAICTTYFSMNICQYCKYILKLNQ